MRISKATELVFEDVRRAQFERKLAGFVREKFPEEQGHRVSRTEARIGLQAARARQHGLDTEQSIAIYVVTAWIMGEDFDERLSAAGDVLNSKFSPEEKADWLEQWAPAVLASLRHG